MGFITRVPLLARKSKRITGRKREDLFRCYGYQQFLRRPFRSIEDITTADIQALFNNMGNCAKETKYKVKTVLGMILCCATEDGIIAKNPILSKRLRINGRQSIDTLPYSVEQMKFLVSNIGKVLTAQDCAYIALQSLHPMRFEEVLGLKWKDIDLDNSHIYIRQVVTHPDRNQPEVKEPKTEKSVRCLNLSAEEKNSWLVENLTILLLVEKSL